MLPMDDKARDEEEVAVSIVVAILSISESI